MNKNITEQKKILIITFISFFISICDIFYAQNRILDFGGWFSFATKYNINNKHSLSAMVRIRQYENYTELNSWYIDVGYAIRSSSSLNISFHYAFNPSITIQNYYRNIHQYYIRTNYRYFVNKYITLHNRIIFQHATHRFVTDIQDNGYQPYYRTDIRERVGISYQLSSLSSVYLYNEIMYTLSDIPVEIRRNRIYAGYEKQINDKWTTKMYFVIQSLFHRKKTPNYHYFILGWDWIFDWNG